MKITHLYLCTMALFIFSSCQFSQEGLDERSNMAQEAQKVQGGSEMVASQTELELAQTEALGSFEHFERPVVKQVVMVRLLKLQDMLAKFLQTYQQQVSAEVLAQLKDLQLSLSTALTHIDGLAAKDGNLPMEWTYTAGKNLVRSGRDGLAPALSFGQELQKARALSFQLCEQSFADRQWPLAESLVWMQSLLSEQQVILDYGADLYPPFEQQLSDFAVQLMPMKQTLLFLQNKLRKKLPPTELIGTLKTWCARSEDEREDLNDLVKMLQGFSAVAKQLQAVESRLDDQGNFDLTLAKYPVEKMSYQDLFDLQSFDLMNGHFKKYLEGDFFALLAQLKDVKDEPKKLKKQKKWKAFVSVIDQLHQRFVDDTDQSTQLLMRAQRVPTDSALARLVKSSLGKDLTDVGQGLEVSRCLMKEVLLQESPGCLDELKNQQN